ncbi:hypothetical protein AUC68_00525 [Methyloceanibacter methanicus]|uniref:Uncharacterized protein n=2 Tax=Methyloceanibacter methanicus TaxID=1774968 RepID=A0A1E3W6G1_9HYPH|nr:hypothetical protein AUC68_00525 [Methyloceanibacter methanicus]
MSPDTAETVANWSNWFFLASLLVGIVATFLLIISGRVKEDNLKRELAHAQEKTAGLELEAIRAKERLLKERAARVTLEMQLSPRTLSRTTQESLKDAIRAFEGETVAVETYAHDAEAANFAEQLIRCLRSAGIQVSSEVASRLDVGRLAIGIIIGGRNEPLAKLIAGRLASAGHLSVAYDPNQAGKQDDSAPGVLILIGARPLPNIERPSTFP